MPLIKKAPEDPEAMRYDSRDAVKREDKTGCPILAAIFAWLGWGVDYLLSATEGLDSKSRRLFAAVRAAPSGLARHRGSIPL